MCVGCMHCCCRYEKAIDPNELQTRVRNIGLGFNLLEPYIFEPEL